MRLLPRRDSRTELYTGSGRSVGCDNAESAEGASEIHGPSSANQWPPRIDRVFRDTSAGRYSWRSPRSHWRLVRPQLRGQLSACPPRVASALLCVPKTATDGWRYIWHLVGARCSPASRGRAMAQGAVSMMRSGKSGRPSLRKLAWTRRVRRPFRNAVLRIGRIGPT